MQFFRTSVFRYSAAFLIGATVGVVYFLSALPTHADTLPSVWISGNGSISVKGAQVVSVHNDEITAVSTWGSAKMVWNILPTSATHFSPERSLGALSTDIHVGDAIGFLGQLDQKSGAYTVYPSTIRNETVMHDSMALDGIIIDAGADGLVVQTAAGTSTIRVSTGTIMTKDGNKADLSDMILGQTIKAFGTMNDRDRILVASRIVSVSDALPKIPNTGGPAKRGLFAMLMSWLGVGGSLSVR